MLCSWLCHAQLLSQLLVLHQVSALFHSASLGAPLLSTMPLTLTSLPSLEPATATLARRFHAESG